MKNYEKLKKLKPELFKRLTGVKLDIFKEMLEYYREYRSMAHMAFDYEVSGRLKVKEVEECL